MARINGKERRRVEEKLKESDVGRTRTYSQLSQHSVGLVSVEGLVENDLPGNQPAVSDFVDGGFGWFIVFVTCFCNFVFFHNRISYGMFIPELTDYFSRSQTDMALVASVESIVRCISCK